MLISEHKGQHTGSVVTGFYITVVWQTLTPNKYLHFRWPVRSYF